jgi:peptidoglycan hydrolase-like protein with peptidoglycan-binding domain
MKKNVMFSLALVLIAALFGGCANMQAANGAGSDSKTTTHAKSASAKHATAKNGQANAEVKILQEALDKAGYKLVADGRMGPKTRTALEKYQKANGLKVTGTVDQATKTKLGLK